MLADENPIAQILLGDWSRSQPGLNRVLLGDQAKIVRELKAEDSTTFVGDGINDARALPEADLGVAIGAGTNVAIEFADLVLVDGDPADVARTLVLARLTRQKMLRTWPGPPATTQLHCRWPSE